MNAETYLAALRFKAVTNYYPRYLHQVDVMGRAGLFGLDSLLPDWVLFDRMVNRAIPVAAVHDIASCELIAIGITIASQSASLISAPNMLTQRLCWLISTGKPIRHQDANHLRELWPSFSRYFRLEQIDAGLDMHIIWTRMEAIGRDWFIEHGIEPVEMETGRGYEI